MLDRSSVALPRPELERLELPQPVVGGWTLPRYQRRPLRDPADLRVLGLGGIQIIAPTYGRGTHTWFAEADWTGKSNGLGIQVLALDLPGF